MTTRTRPEHSSRPGETDHAPGVYKTPGMWYSSLNDDEGNDMKVLEYSAAGELLGVRDSKELTAEEWARVKKDKSGALRPARDES